MNDIEKKAAVKRFYNEVILKGSSTAAEELLLDDYKQHNPQAANGKDGLLFHVAELQAQYPNRKIEFIHLFVEGDFVITHIHFTLIPKTLGAMGMDIFRFEGDKIAEHWDVIQEIPTQAANDNGMF